MTIGRVHLFASRATASTLLSILLWGGLLIGFASPADAAKKIRVFTSSTDLQAIAEEVGGERVEVYCPFPGYQEPELWVEEVFPNWMLKAAKSDMYVRIGLMSDLWADTIIQYSRNRRIFPGEPGYVDASRGIEVIEVPTGSVDRSRGEIHIQGNPHYLLDPENARIVAVNIMQHLSAVSPGDAELFRANTEDFIRRIDEAMVRWREMAAPLKGVKIAAYHKTWSYFVKRFGIEVVGYCEPKPGIEPSPREMKSLIGRMKDEGVKLIIKAPVYADRVPKFISEQVGVGGTYVTLPAHVGGVPEVKDYFDLFDYLIRTLNDALGLSVGSAAKDEIASSR